MSERRRLPAQKIGPRCVVLAIILVVTLILEGVGLAFLLAPSHASAANAIQAENSLPGDPSWDDFASVAQQDAISGFGSQISVNHGQALDLFVTTTASSFAIDIFRMGWYGGAGARKVTALGSFPGVHNAIPIPDPVTGVVVCNWPKTTTLTVPMSWTTGVYLAKLTTSTGNKSFIFFNVRNDTGTEEIVFQTSVTTYQAYNAWGGVSLYDNTTNKASYKYAHATKVSFDRPFDPNDSNGAGHFLYAEYPFIRWAEKQGYNLTYITDVDTHTNVNPLTNHKAFLSVGHDEYWSKGMRDTVQNAINWGVNVGFFGSNNLYWQIRFEPNAAGTPNRVEVGYKDAATFNGAPGPDPMWNVNNAVVTTNWRDPVVGLPENGIMGTMYEGQVPNNNYPYVVQNASHWVFAGTGFSNGSSVPGIVGYEYDKVWNNGASPPGLTTLSNSPVCCGDTGWSSGGNSASQSTIYTASSGARVFSAGTIDWSWGLDNYTAPYANAGIQKTTANILNNFSGGSVPNPTPTPTFTPTPTPNATATPTPTPNATFTPTPTPNATFTPTPTPNATFTPTPTPNATATPTPTFTPTPGQTAAVLFSDGFEGASLPGPWTVTRTSTNNGVSLDTTVKHGGNASLKASMVKGSAGNAYISKTIAGQATLAVRGYYHLSAPVNFGAVQLMGMYAQGNFIGWVSYNVDANAPTLTVYNGANNTFYSCGAGPSLNAWHSIELRYTLSTGTAGSFSLWLDGTQVCGKTGIKTQPASGLSVNQVVVGSDGADNTVGLTVRVDDVVISKSPVGP